MNIDNNKNLYEKEVDLTMKKKKLLSILILSTFLTLYLGCGDGNGGSNPNSNITYNQSIKFQVDAITNVTNETTNTIIVLKKTIDEQISLVGTGPGYMRNLIKVKRFTSPNDIGSYLNLNSVSFSPNDFADINEIILNLEPVTLEKNEIIKITIYGESFTDQNGNLNPELSINFTIQ